MKYVRNILLLVGLQAIGILTLLWQLYYMYVYFELTNLKGMILLLCTLTIPLLYLFYVNWLEKVVMDHLIEEDTNKRLEAIDLERDIRNHEVFRELQMIKVIAESGCYERLDDFLA